MGNKKTEKRKAERERVGERTGRKRVAKSVRRREGKVNERRDAPGEKPRGSIWAPKKSPWD